MDIDINIDTIQNWLLNKRLTRADERAIDSIINNGLSKKELARFFGCSPLEFEVVFKPQEMTEGLDVDQNINSGLGKPRMELIVPQRECCATFTAEGDRNILSIHNRHNSKDLASNIRHELAHGYHYRNNISLRLAKEQYHSDLLELRYYLGEDKDMLLPEKGRKCLANMANLLMVNTISAEMIAYGYQAIKSGKRKGLGCYFSFDIPKPVIPHLSKEDPLYKHIRSLLKFKMLSQEDLECITTKDIVSYLKSIYHRAYTQFVSIQASGFLFIDFNREPEISITTEKVPCDEANPTGVRVYAKSAYPQLPHRDAKERLKQWFRQDCWELTTTLMSYSSNMIDRADAALLSWYEHNGR